MRGARKRVGHQIDRLGAALGEDDLVLARGIEEFLNGAPRRFIGVGGGGGKIMHAAMDIGVFAFGETRHRLQHRARLLRRSAAVEIDQRLAIDLRATGCGNRRAPLPHRKPGVILTGAVMRATSFSATFTAPRTASRRSVLAISVNASSRKACNQQMPRVLFRNAARAQIEQRIRIQIAHRRAMGAFDIIGEDFQFGLEIGFGAPAQQQAPWRSGDCPRRRRPVSPSPCPDRPPAHVRPPHF